MMEYFDQVELMLTILPIVGQEEAFALKGGTGLMTIKEQDYWMNGMNSLTGMDRKDKRDGEQMLRFIYQLVAYVLRANQGRAFLIVVI